MIDETLLLGKLQAKINEITATISTELKDEKPLVAMLQSTRARALMDLVDCIKECATVDDEV